MISQLKYLVDIQKHRWSKSVIVMINPTMVLPIEFDI